MVPELEKPRITELHVPMNCNGCIQKIKRALHSIEGIYDTYIDFAQQKLTVVGRADPEKIVRAIKKTRKIATICSHTEASDPNSSEPPPADQTNSEQPEADAVNQPSSEAPYEAAPPLEPTEEAPTPPENPDQEVKPSPERTDIATSQPSDPSEPKDVEEIHMIHHYPQHYGNREHWNNYSNNSYGTQHETPYYVTHSYRGYRPSGSRSKYGYHRSPPQNAWYNGLESYHDDCYHTRSNCDGNSITSLFSDGIQMHVELCSLAKDFKALGNVSIQN